eukprot:c14836_g1_i1.p1 GENE.c14836_g1_i1~~c14836_g1_i1.p1  ORF type:complete len:347 (+),score=76.36 c14836_g1_i1:37-1077(+)
MVFFRSKSGQANPESEILEPALNNGSLKYEKPDLSLFVMKNTLGTGTFGRVKLIQDKQTAQFHALKMLKKSEIIKLKQVDHIKNEKAILQMLDHPFVVNMLGVFQNPRSIFMVLEYVPGGELFSLLRKENKFSNDVSVFYAGQVALAFEYMHSQNIVYRDLKPENLLIGGDGYLKVTDFGFAKVVEDRTWTLCGTPEYLAPEIIQSRGHGKGVDWWALGILIYEMLAGYPPFYDDTPFGIYQKILHGNLEFPSDFSKSARDLIRKLLQKDRTKRFGTLKNGPEDIKTHPWFKALDWQALYFKRLRPPYLPKISSPGDTSNFDEYPESDGNSGPIVDKDGAIFGDFC